MDRLSEKFSKVFQSEFEQLMKSIEPETRAGTLKAFECMASCFRQPGSFDSCSDCASRCNDSMRAFQSELKSQADSIKSTLDTCVQNCKSKFSNHSSSEAERCMDVCGQEVIDSYRNLRPLAKDIGRKYV